MAFYSVEASPFLRQVQDIFREQNKRLCSTLYIYKTVPAFLKLPALQHAVQAREAEASSGQCLSQKEFQPQLLSSFPSLFIYLNYGM